MPLYYITEDVTREGMMSCKEAPGRARKVVEFATRFDVKVIEFHYCMANFDFIMKVEAPDDEAVCAFAMAVRRTGNVTARVTRAFSPEEWGAMVEKIPD